ncbi:MAG: EAL domain-containing protein [Acidobacteriota bacterium]|jgi:EAL domain-containing protein (putative c-di-GMP-specific phosphodiesterase class I)|nr:EAL domain-containing protein [Acidobacteriota bacterium]
MDFPDLRYVTPFFQPIIAADNLGVFAYEVLAREVHSGSVRSLGPFFEDPAVSDTDKLVLDRHVRGLALEKFAASGSSGKLFINLKPSWINSRQDAAGDATLAKLESLKIDPESIVIEVTEEELLSDNDEFGRLLARYRREGCMLAIDDFGKGSSNVERIAYVNPDIVKIDSSIVQKVDSHRSFFEICRAMSAFGDISGFDLLFEGVETAYQLERCVTAKGKYFQGYVFSKARPELDTGYENRDLLTNILAVRTYCDLADVRHRHEIAQEIEVAVERLCTLVPGDADALAAPDALAALVGELPYYCIRCFVCDRQGRQLSAVCRIGSHCKVVAQGDSRGSSWFFKGFFVAGLLALQDGRRGFLSDVYKSVAAKESVATYMYALPDERLLCIDIIPTALT